MTTKPLANWPALLPEKIADAYNPAKLNDKARSD